MLKAIALDDEPIALEVIKSLSRKVVFHGAYPDVYQFV
jgi:hypothetical protein